MGNVQETMGVEMLNMDSAKEATKVDHKIDYIISNFGDTCLVEEYLDNGGNVIGVAYIAADMGNNEVFAMAMRRIDENEDCDSIIAMAGGSQIDVNIVSPYFPRVRKPGLVCRMITDTGSVEMFEAFIPFLTEEFDRQMAIKALCTSDRQDCLALVREKYSDILPNLEEFIESRKENPFSIANMKTLLEE